jgi:hypothetical protein
MYLIVGDYHQAQLPRSPFVAYLPSYFKIEEYIQNCDEVAGILLGRVNLEARACNKVSWVYDPETLERKKYYPTRKEFEDKHDIKKVAESLLKVFSGCIS